MIEVLSSVREPWTAGTVQQAQYRYEMEAHHA